MTEFFMEEKIMVWKFKAKGITLNVCQCASADFNLNIQFFGY
jgi:hypothetical protein